MEAGSSKPKFWVNFDWSLFGCMLALCAIGLLTLFSSTYFNQINVFYKQVVWVTSGLTLSLLITLLDYRFYERLSYYLYGLVILLLLLVFFIGKTVYGSQRWIPLGPVHIQPSELAKLAVVFVLARYYSKERGVSREGYGFRALVPIFALVGVPMFLVFIQPDLGSALMVGFVAATIILFCNLKVKTLIIMIVGMAITVPLAYKFVLKEYQRDRVRTFLDPTRDPLGDGYHSLQSIITVGSGQMLGKGYLQGTQSKLEFLPKHHTDFIFSAFAEEWGFLGSTLLMALFMVFILLGIDVVRKSKDKFGSVLALGSLSVIVWHVIVNIGMEIGLLPVVGVPLPFFSYGGSSLFTNMIAFGILMSVSIRKHIF